MLVTQLSIILDLPPQRNRLNFPLWFVLLPISAVFVLQGRKPIPEIFSIGRLVVNLEIIYKLTTRCTILSIVLCTQLVLFAIFSLRFGRLKGHFPQRVEETVFWLRLVEPTKRFVMLGDVFDGRTKIILDLIFGHLENIGRQDLILDSLATFDRLLFWFSMKHLNYSQMML